MALKLRFEDQAFRIQVPEKSNTQATMSLWYGLGGENTGSGQDSQNVRMQQAFGNTVMWLSGFWKNCAWECTVAHMAMANGSVSVMRSECRFSKASVSGKDCTCLE